MPKKVHNQNNGISRFFLAIYGYLWEDPIIYYFYLLRKTSIFIIYCWNITTTTFKKLKTEQSYVVKLYSILWSRNQNPPSPSLLYLNNVYYIIHIFCRLFFCVFFPISTHFFKNLTITLYYSAIYFLATLLCTTITVYNFTL